MKLGIQDKMLQHLTKFLGISLIETLVNRMVSNCTGIKNGIIKGATISPALYNTAIHNIYQRLPAKVECIIFADNTSIFKSNKDAGYTNT